MLRLLLLVLFFGGVPSLAVGCEEDAESSASAAPVEVEVELATTREIPNRFEFIGTVEPIQRVELRTRVRGYVTAIGFEEGAVVEEGQVLFELDTRPLRAGARAAAASVRQTRAQLAEARRQLARERRLHEAGVSSAEQVEAAQTNVTALKAQVNEQRAGLRQATLDVGYSSIEAPFRGRIGERLVDVGDLVGEGDGAPLAVMVQEDPMFVRFSPTERERRELLALDPTLESRVNEGEQLVQVTLSDGTTLDPPGRLTFVDNALDPSTRSLLYKATVANEARTLKAGESVMVTLPMPPTEQVVVPAIAVASVQDVDYVFVVDDEENGQDRAHYREVELGRTVGDDRVIRSGLEAGERVVVHGMQRVRDGAKVQVVRVRVVDQRAAAAVDEARTHRG